MQRKLDDHRDKRDEWKIMRVLVRNPKLTARQVKSECSLNTKVSVDTLCRVLQKQLESV